jgi:hypothetical protein
MALIRGWHRRMAAWMQHGAKGLHEIDEMEFRQWF